ncbi:ABC transporter permease [Nonomuraea lactucae]|uniref:ABC transporter permease n=1 Tax=Nonomuraea lactucae TaxID=2249762 RepID=UPI000DE1BDDA|nr:ABC transporter permease [Nonomuraea lactucae]
MATTPSTRSGRSPGRIAFDRLKRDPAALFGASIVAVFVAVALGAPLLTALSGWDVQTFDKSAIDRSLGGVPYGDLGGIGAEHWLGVEPGTGRDVFARIVYGARVSLLISVAATAVTVVAGTVIGLVAGYVGGRTDTILCRVMDLVMSFPSLIFMLALLSVAPDANRVLLLIAIMSMFSWPYVGRIVRGQALSLKHQEFVDAARVGGGRAAHILFKEMLPNITGPILVYTTLAIPANIGTEAALSFLGVGVRPPTPSWGQMLDDSLKWYQVVPSYFIVPSVCLFLTVLAFTLLGDALRDALDPRGTNA